MNIIKIFKEQIKKYDLIYYIIFLSSLIVRIPRYGNIYGSDTFEVIWMAQGIVHGALFGTKTWLISPLSFFGFYPFSHYPIGLPLLIALFMKIGFSLKVIILMFDFVITVLAFKSCYFFANRAFDKEYQKHIFAISFLLANNDFYKYTYFTIHPRAIILVISLVIFGLLLKIEKQKQANKKQIFSITFLTFFSLLIHRVALIFIFIIFLFFIYRFIFSKKFFRKIIRFLEKNGYYTKIMYLLILFALIISVFIIPPTQGSFYVIQEIKNSTLQSVLGVTLNYITRLGIFSFFLPIGVIFIFSNREETSSSKFIQILILLLALIWIKQVYTIILFLPIFCLISTNGLVYSLNLLKLKIKSTEKLYYFLVILFIIFSYVIFLTYSIFFVFIKHLFVFISLITIFFSLISLKLLNNNSAINKIKDIFLISLMISNIITMVLIFENRQYNLGASYYPYSQELSSAFISDDEYQVIDFIKNQGCDGIVFTTSFKLAKRINGAGFLPTIVGQHFGQLIYYGWISAEDVKNNTVFSWSFFFMNLGLEYKGIKYEYYIYNITWSLNISDPDDYQKLVDLKIQYVVAIEGNPTDSPLIKSFRYIPPAFETEYLIVWKLY